MLEEEEADHKLRVARLHRLNKQFNKLKACGLDFLTDHTRLYSFHRPIKREDLAAIRQAFGPLKVQGKEVPYDYYEKEEINVVVTPKDPDVDITFCYRKHYTGNGKCKVVEVPTTYKTLVCKK
jgi:hypothetical protein